MGDYFGEHLEKHPRMIRHIQGTDTLCIMQRTTHRLPF